ncbi:MAG: beta-ketoacyl synthase N-terminal-like domain-containing protein [Planctomycetota bacterium]
MSTDGRTRRRVGVFGWGVVAPRSPDIESFTRNLQSAESWLTPFDGFGPSNYLVGKPNFDFEAYRPWLEERFPPRRFQQLASKMGEPTLFAIGSFIQALSQNPGIEEELQNLGGAAHVYVGTGLGDIGTIAGCAVEFDRHQQKWNRFWTDPERNRALAAHLAGDSRVDHSDAPPDPAQFEDEDERADARREWCAYWCRRSPQLQEYLAELREIESTDVSGDVESGKAASIRRKMTLISAVQKRWGVPTEPWAAVSPNLLWNIHNTPAAQISMLGRITGSTFAPVAACSTFGYTLRLAMDAIDRGDAKAVVIGATDPSPHPLVVGTFSSARVLAQDGQVSKPLTGLRGTHAAGGSCVWIVGDLEHFRARGFRPLGLEPLGVGVSSDADHIITPSSEGPLAAIDDAFSLAGARPEETGTWDLHATATPGDFLEVENARRVLPESVLLTARKGTFGHGMGASGGWELLAQYLGYEAGAIPATSLRHDELNPEIAKVHGNFVEDEPKPLPEGVAGKLSMGVGGVNACVISRRYPD